MPSLLKRLFGISTQRDHFEAYNKRRLDNNKGLRERMKPKDGIRGFMFDPDMPKGVIVPLDKVQFLEAYLNPKKGRDNAINREQVRWCSKAFSDNNDNHLMITIYVSPEGNIHLLEGNHRLELLRQRSDQTVILANVINNSQYNDEEFDKTIKTLMEKCGRPDVLIEQHGPVVYCNIDYDGHFIHTLEYRIEALYYTIGELTGNSEAPKKVPV